MKNAFKSLLLVVTMLMAGTVAFAQVTTASLGGRIVDTKGETIIGAAVVATHRACVPAVLTSWRFPASVTRP